MSTQFQHKDIHKGTWQSPDNNNINQIDHVLTNGNKHELIEDVRSLRGPNIDADHFLVKVIMKQSLPTIYKNKNKQEINIKWNQKNLQNAVKLKGYCKKLYENLIKLDEKEDINEEWNSIQQAIKESANVTIMKQEVQPRNKWWD
ncbi:hypothetical protein L9F63_011676 [Diploptera punctata]|uniref:Uncharacterized protein n=1 Tax=Diploptera punctata TaxID=6984 RepID=A0AAD8AEA0_DIPPU|nr:hypothetical protein L9F63_011676 [Diploptera punctata]